MVFKDLNRKSRLFIGLLVLATLPAWGNLNFIKDNTLFQTQSSAPGAQSVPKIDVSGGAENNEWGKILAKHQSWVEQVEYDSAKYQVNYSFNNDLEGFIKKQLSIYRPDFTSVVVM